MTSKRGTFLRNIDRSNIGEKEEKYNNKIERADLKSAREIDARNAKAKKTLAPKQNEYAVKDARARESRRYSSRILGGNKEASEDDKKLEKVIAAKNKKKDEGAISKLRRKPENRG